MNPNSRLVLVGLGHAHVETAAHLRSIVTRGHEVTIVSPAIHHYYSGMGPGLLAGIYRPMQARFDVKAMALRHGARFVMDEVVTIDAAAGVLQLGGGQAIPYDVASFNVGSLIAPLPVEANDGKTIVLPVKPIKNLLQVRQLLTTQPAERVPRHVVIVGAGAAGTEVAGCLARLRDDTGQSYSITLISSTGLLPTFPTRAAHLVQLNFAQRNVDVLTGNRVTRIADGHVQLADGNTVPADLVISAAGVQPPDLFRRSGLPVGEDGGLLVTDALHSTAHPNLFGGGDCISLQSAPIPRVGVHAVREGPVLRHNLTAALTAHRLRLYRPQTRYLLILNLGDGTGLFVRNGLVFNGRLFFRMKNRIDLRFMHHYQLRHGNAATPPKKEH